MNKHIQLNLCIKVTEEIEQYCCALHKQVGLDVGRRSIKFHFIRKDMQQSKTYELGTDSVIRD